MLKNLVLISLLWYGLRGYGVDLQEYYVLASGYLANHHQVVLMYGILGALGMVLISYIFAAFNLHTLMHLFASLFFELTQFSICLISLVAVTFWLGFHVNVWRDLGLTIILPFAWLFASCFSLRIFDFNYPVTDKILSNILLALVSGIIILGAALVKI